MHTLTRGRIASVIAISASLVVLGSCSRSSPGPSIGRADSRPAAPQSSGVRTQLERWADEIQTTGGRQPVSTGYPSLASERVGSQVRDWDLSVVALRWSGDLGGGVVLLGPGDTLLQVYPYPGARGLLPAGPGRVAFWYTATRGSNEYESRIVVRCSLAYGVTYECLNVVAERRDVVQGLATVTQATNVRIVGDTVILDRRLSLLRDRERAPREMSLGLSRWILPSIPPQ